MSYTSYPVIDPVATGARIKELRQQHHMKVWEVARFMGFESEQAVYKWQRGESLPTVDNLYALSMLFGTTMDAIICGDREEDESPLLPFYSVFFESISKISACCGYLFCDRECNLLFRLVLNL